MYFSYQSVLVEVLKIPYLFDEKGKKKEPPSELNSAPCPLFHRKWTGELMYLLDPSGLTGLEPATSALTGRCSDQLNYNPREIKGFSRKLASFLFPRIRYF